MKRHWNVQELREHWSLSVEERSLVAHKAPRSQLAFAVLLKFFQLESRFPRDRREVPQTAVEDLAQQLDVSPAQFDAYDWHGRTGKAQRSAIRARLGFRRATEADATHLLAWLRREMLPQDPDEAHVQDYALAWYRERRIEPPTSASLRRSIRAALRGHEIDFCTTISTKLPPATQHALEALLEPALAPTTEEGTTDHADAEPIPFNVLKADPGRVGVASVLKEVAKLRTLTALHLPKDLFATVSPKVLATYRLRAATAPPNELRRHPDPTRFSLLAAFCWERRQKIIDGLVELLLQLVHRITVWAETKVVKALLGDVQQVHGKTALLYKLAEAAVAHPEGTIREVVYPVVGEQTLSELVKEYHAKGPAYRHQVHTFLRRSYSHHYRQMMPHLLEALTFRSNNAVHRPVIDALAWLKAHRESRQQYVSWDEVPIEGVVRPSLRDLLVERDRHGVERINRINYEICVLQALREQVRCKEIWVEGADRYRNPDDDLPKDFAAKRVDYFQALNQPLDAQAFVTRVQQEMAQWLARLDVGLPSNPKVSLRPQGKHRIRLSPLDAQPEPQHLEGVKAEMLRRWPMTNLLDVLKEADLRLGFTQGFKTLASREILDRTTLQQRLLLCLYGLGTNAALKRMVSGETDLSYRELLYVRRRFIQQVALRAAIAHVINATLAVRRPEVWGEGTTACASDAKKVGAWDQNLMTEWHIRYGGRGVMIYWHVERRAACIYSQLKRRSCAWPRAWSGAASIPWRRPSSRAHTPGG